MKVILLGASGMVGQGVLRECLLDPQVTSVLSIGRSSTRKQHPKLRELIQSDLFNLSPVEAQLSGYDACFFCLGVSSIGMSKEDYRRTTYDLTLSVAQTLVRSSPQMTFIYVTGAGTDGREQGAPPPDAGWARVKGATENALLRLPFEAAYMFRPGYIQPLHGIEPKTKWLKTAYSVITPLYPLWKLLLGKRVMTTEELGRAMLRAAREGAPKKVLEARDITELGRERGSKP